jgi:hypothetical protein
MARLIQPKAEGEIAMTNAVAWLAKNQAAP